MIARDELKRKMLVREAQQKPIQLIGHNKIGIYVN